MEQEEAVTGKELDESLDATLRETLKGITERGEGVVDEPEPDKPAVEAEPAAVAPKTDERPRDASGKFIEKPKEPAAAAETAKPAAQAAAATVPAAAESEAPLVTTTGQPIDINRPPSSWKPAAKAAWMSLAPEIRTEIHRREGDFLHGGKAQQVDADFGRSIKQTVEPYRMLIEAEGGTPERAIADLFRTAALFRTGQPQQKLQALFGIAQQFNVPLAEYMQSEFAKAKGDPNAQAQAQAQPQSFQDPRVDQLLAAQQKQERDRVAQETRVSNSATERFLTAKDDKGQPLYPFVDNVLDDMSDRVSSIRRTNPAIGHEEALKQAYEAAVWANPETRAVLIGQQQAQAQQSAETLRKVAEAKRASAGNMPRRGALPATEPVGSIEDTIRDTYRRLTG